MKEDIIKMAREAGIDEPESDWMYWAAMERFAALVVASIDPKSFMSYQEGFEAGRLIERNKVAQWMIDRSYATGHGDTTEDLLQELEWQIAENWTRGMVNGVEAEREACAKVCDDMIGAEYATGKVDHNEMGWTQACAAAIRTRGES